MSICELGRRDRLMSNAGQRPVIRFVEKTWIVQVLQAAICLLVLLSGCSSSVRFASKGTEASPSSRRVTEESTPDGSKIVRVNPGKVLLTLEGIASYYADDFHGKMTSNGEIFDMHSLTAAHKVFPFGTKVRVTNLENGKSVVVRINDRGPFVGARIIDLSLGAAKELEMVQKGTTRVRLEVLEWGDGKYVGQEQK